MTRSVVMLGALCLMLAGCPTSEPVPGSDAGRDAAIATGDTGTGADTGTAEDTGVGTDTGVGADTGVADDTGVATDTGPMEDAGPLMGECTNDADLAALPMDYMGMDISEHTSACAMQCLFSGAMAGAMRQMCINDCLQGPERIDGAITSECTNCYALAAECTIANCLGACAASPTAAACITCQCGMCSEATVACSGIPDSRCTP
jgi:hypothetical protein